MKNKIHEEENVIQGQLDKLYEHSQESQVKEDI